MGGLVSMKYQISGQYDYHHCNNNLSRCSGCGIMLDHFGVSTGESQRSRVSWQGDCVTAILFHD
jgi:hypothetical protein